MKSCISWSLFFPALCLDCRQTRIHLAPLPIAWLQHCPFFLPSGDFMHCVFLSENLSSSETPRRSPLLVPPTFPFFLSSSPSGVQFAREVSICSVSLTQKESNTSSYVCDRLAFLNRLAIWLIGPSFFRVSRPDSRAAPRVSSPVLMRRPRLGRRLRSLRVDDFFLAYVFAFLLRS